jgi:hypothetical protein
MFLKNINYIKLGGSKKFKFSFFTFDKNETLLNISYNFF